MRRIISLAIVAIALTACSSATSGKGTDAPTAPSSVPTLSPPTTEEPVPTDSVPPTPVAKAIGVTLILSDDTGDVAHVTVTSVRTATYDPSVDENAANGLFVIVNVSATGVGSPYSINPSDFYLTGRDGAHSEDLTFSDHWGAPMQDATLHKGERIHGVMVFDATKGSRHGKIYYSPNSNGDPIGFWVY